MLETYYKCIKKILEKNRIWQQKIAYVIKAPKSEKSQAEIKKSIIKSEKKEENQSSKIFFAARRRL